MRIIALVAKDMLLPCNIDQEVGNGASASALSAVLPVCTKWRKIASNMPFLTHWVDPNQPETTVVQLAVVHGDELFKRGYKRTSAALRRA